MSISYKAQCHMFLLSSKPKIKSKSNSLSLSSTSLGIIQSNNDTTQCDMQHTDLHIRSTHQLPHNHHLFFVCQLYGFSPMLVTNYTWFWYELITNHINMHSEFLIWISNYSSHHSLSYFLPITSNLDTFCHFKHNIQVHGVHRAHWSTTFIFIWDNSAYLYSTVTKF